MDLTEAGCRPPLALQVGAGVLGLVLMAAIAVERAPRVAKGDQARVAMREAVAATRPEPVAAVRLGVNPFGALSLTWASATDAPPRKVERTALVEVPSPTIQDADGPATHASAPAEAEARRAADNAGDGLVQSDVGPGRDAPPAPPQTPPVSAPMPSGPVVALRGPEPVIVPLPPTIPSRATTTGRSERSVAEESPGPVPRLAQMRSVGRREANVRGPEVASRSTGAATAAARPTPTTVASAGEDQGFLSKFFGMLKGPASSLSYAAPETGAVTGRVRAGADGQTAVYDISAHTIYMPDGSRLEAHSGLGDRIDDPRHVNERMRGSTPPHLYDLTARESLFHGVKALRLTPVGEGHVYGRNGLLAHTYMLGGRGDSNGCVSFKDYASFLKAYESGRIKRLSVVAGTS